MKKPNDYPILPFASPAAWAAWLDKNHATSQGVWVRMYKAGSAEKSIVYKEALEEALCYGWIDGQAKSYDDTSWIQKFTPRRPKSLWSDRNRERVARLVRQKRMKAAGLAEVKAAKADGRWHRAYDSPARMGMPEDLAKALRRNAKAAAFYKSLNRANVYAIAWRLQTATKPETRAKRLGEIVRKLERGEKWH
jgi:uncharacterized protein YdeI (YjbR/CyaY-like superfamily)